MRTKRNMIRHKKKKRWYVKYIIQATNNGKRGIIFHSDRPTPPSTDC